MKTASVKLFTILLERLVKSGLPLVSPHAEMIWKKEKTLIIKNKQLDLSDFKILCDYSGKAFGFIRCREPRSIGLEEFKTLESKHRIDESRREKLWPGTESFLGYEIRDFFPFAQPRKIKKPTQETHASIREVVFKNDDFDPRIIAEELKELSNKQLVSLHAQVHKFWEERGARASDELVINSHILIVEEIKRRGMEHRMKDELDEVSAELMGIHVREPYVYIDDLAKIWEKGFVLKDPFLAIIGSTVVSGRGADIDLWVNLSTDKDAIGRLLEDLEFRLRSFLNENLNDRIHLVPDPEGKYTSFIPLARLKVEFLKPEEQELIIMRDGKSTIKHIDRESVIKDTDKKTQIAIMKALHQC